MRLIGKFRFSIGALMMFVLMVAAGSALFVKIQEHVPSVVVLDWGMDVPILFLLAIVLTAVALGSWKDHTAVQIMLQVTLACFGCLTLIWVGEAKYERAIRYWCQGTFAASVTLPMLARRYVKSALPRGRRRDSWKKMSEAVFFSFLTMMLITVGILFQAGVYVAATNLMGASVSSAPLATVAPPQVIPTAPPSAVPPSLDPGIP